MTLAIIVGLCLAKPIDDTDPTDTGYNSELFLLKKIKLGALLAKKVILLKKLG